jgi:hypothetical protein
MKMQHNSRSPEEVRFWKETYEMLGLEYYAIAPGSKAYYKDIDPWVGFAMGGNIAVDTKSSKVIALDVDASLSSLMRKVANKTLSIKSPKGYGIILHDTMMDKSYSVIRALKMNNRGEWAKVDKDLLKDALKVGKFLAKLGLKDSTAIHSDFPDTDGLTYMLLPPSETCKWQGYKGTVLGHSTCLSICNQSPNGKHDFRARSFVHYTTDLLDWDEFCRMVKLKI